MLEWIGVVTGVLYVWLAARQSMFCWPTSLLNLSVYFYVFSASGLYADAGLQIFYLALTFYGWWSWKASHADARPPLNVRTLSTKERLAVLGAVAVGTAVLFGALRAFTPSTVPLLDAHTTALSLVAQALTARKILESWTLWIWANVFYCGLYLQKGLYPTVGLYFLFIVLAGYGYREWRRTRSFT